MTNLELTEHLSRVDAVVMFVDISDSTAMKDREIEAAWITTYLWYYKTVSEVVKESLAGRVVKYLGDGVMAVFESDFAAEAINAAIDIQSRVTVAVREKLVPCKCAIALASGVVHKFPPFFTIESANGTVCDVGEDYLGRVVDIAAHLCDVAAPNAIFVDKATVATARMNHVRSPMGVAGAHLRTADEYLGVIQKTPLPGFAVPQEYYEIFWAEQRFGVKSDTLTKAVDSRAAADGTQHVLGVKPNEVVRRGTVRRWDRDTGRGFIVSGEEFFYADTRFIVGAEPLEAGQTVFFVAHDPLVEGKNPVAACVLVLGHRVTGKLISANVSKGFGFVSVGDAQRNTYNVFMYVGDNPLGIRLGDDIEFTVSENEKGATAEEVTKA